MTVTMYDSVNPRAIPADAEAVAGYLRGGDYYALVARFPHAHHLSISTSALVDGDCLDVETGDASPSDAPGWVRKQHVRGLTRPAVYSNSSTMPAVIAALTHDGIGRDQYRVWTAHWTGFPHIEPGSDATQYFNSEAADIDISLCSDTFFGIKPPYVPGDEVNWEREWDKIKDRNTPAAHFRRLFLKRQMVHRERLIVSRAKKTGWNLLNRKARYEKLFARTKAR